MTNNKPDIATMKAELEAAGYEIKPRVHLTDSIEWFFYQVECQGDYIYTTAPIGNPDDKRKFALLQMAIHKAHAHLQQQRELARYRELGKQACDIPIGASIDQERIIDRMDEVYKLITLPNITANDDESDDGS